MKKIILLLLVLISVMIAAGCKNSRTSVTRFSAESATDEAANESAEASKTTVTPVAEEKRDIPPPIALAPKEPEKKAEEAKAATPATEFKVIPFPRPVTKTKKGYHLIEGTTPAETASIEVNGAPLDKFKSGDMRWSYVAAVSLGNLKKGANSFTVRALDAEKKELGSRTFTIDYIGIENGSLAATGPDAVSLAGLFTIFTMAAGMAARGKRL